MDIMASENVRYRFRWAFNTWETSFFECFKGTQPNLAPFSCPKEVKPIIEKIVVSMNYLLAAAYANL